MNKTTVIQGREIAHKDIELVRQLINTNPFWGRTCLSKELCSLWKWKTVNGRLKDMACSPRDSFIGWNHDQRGKNLSLVTNNMRFLILPWVKMKHLVSHILSKVIKQIKDDWEHKYGHPVYLLETFVECDRFKGTCYRASNWTCVGKTKGRSRNDRYSTIKVPVKDIYLYPLTKRFRKVLDSEA